MEKDEFTDDENYELPHKNITTNRRADDLSDDDDENLKTEMDKDESSDDDDNYELSPKQITTKRPAAEVSDDENYESCPKKMKTEWTNSYSNKAMDMMRKMGYQQDKGLGKQGQGRLEPVVAVQQDGRRGFGHKLDKLIRNSGNKWDPECENITLPETIEWIRCEAAFDYTMDDMKQWLHVDTRKTTIKDETLYCDPEILNRILEGKTVFDELNDNDLRRGRSRCNPFETIRSSIFLNRAAVKMANIDSMCDFMFTNPKNQFGQSLLQDNELLYFADICAGPGGFSEYVLYRKSWEAKGFGFTLKGMNDFKLDKFFAGSPESFDPYYGVKDDGNIFDEENQDSFADYIFKHSETGVHFVMADGGFSVEGQENIQEVLSKQLYLCQCLTALKILRDQGSFVCKLFDLFTPFSVGLMYLLYQSFEEIAIIKPNSSRPANSERYVVCKWKKPNIDPIISYLNHVNSIYNDGGDDDVHELVDSGLIGADEKFKNYIIESNNIIGQNQVIGLRKIAAFCANAELKETRQSEYRKKCLELWNLPDKLRQAPEMKTTDKVLEDLLKDWYVDRKFFTAEPVNLHSLEALNKNVKSVFDWCFVPIGRCETNINACSIFLCKSRGSLLRFTDKKWEQVDILFEVAPQSLFYGEIVNEFNGEGKTLTRGNGLHIIDAIMLGGIDVRRLKLHDRLKMCHKFAESLNKPHKDGKHGAIRAKRLYNLQELNNFFNEMRPYTLKDNSSRLGFCLNGDSKFFVPGGILLFCHIFQNLMSLISKSHNKLYYFDMTANRSYFIDSMPPDVYKMLYASFRNSFGRRLQWKWSSTLQVDDKAHPNDDQLLYRSEFQKFINSFIQRLN